MTVGPRSGERLTVAAAAVLAALAAAHSTAHQEPPSQPVFRAATHVIEVDATVQDKDGRFVLDLTRDDFEVLEDGRLQQIETFYLVRSGAPSSTAVAPSSPEPAASPSSAAESPAGSPDRRILVFVFDTEHVVSPGSLSRARAALEEFLKTELRPGDVGGIVAGGAMINNRLTSDVDELRRAAASVKPSGAMRARQLELREFPRLRDELEALRIAQNDREALQAAVTRACGDDQGLCEKADLLVREKAGRVARGIEQATELTLRSLDALVRGLARLLGRKTVVFFSDGFVAEERLETLASVVGQAGRAGVRFYSVDLRGLDRGASSIIDQPLADDPAGAPAQFDVQSDGPTSLAVDTGGFAIRNENNFGRALAMIGRDAGTYYVLGYRPTNTNFDGKFRQITVRVKRPDVKVRARRGYLAVPPGRGASAEPPVGPGHLEPTAPAPEPAAPADPTPPAAAGAPPAVAATAAPSVPASAPPSAPAPDTSPAAVRLRPDRLERARELASGATLAPGAAQRGWELYQKGDVEGARAALLEAVKAAQPSPWVRYVLGLSEFALLRYREAAAQWRVVRSEQPAFKPVYFDLADALLQTNDFGEAVSILRDGTRRWPDDAEMFNALGVVLARRGALDDAVQAFERAVAIAADDPLGHFNLARAFDLRYFRTRRYVRSENRWVANERDRARAIEHYERCVALDPDGPQAAGARESIARLQWRSPAGAYP